MEHEYITLTPEQMGAVKLTSLPVPKSYDWKPQPDITAFELARCLPAFFSGDIESLPPECQRHFEERK